MTSGLAGSSRQPTAGLPVWSKQAGAHLWWDRAVGTGLSYTSLPIRRQSATRVRRPPPLGMWGSVGLGCRQLRRETGSQQPTAGPIAKSPCWLSLSSARIKIQDIAARIVNPGWLTHQGRFILGVGLAICCATLRADAAGVGLPLTGGKLPDSPLRFPARRARPSPPGERGQGPRPATARPMLARR
jgi:hypothetical protein